MRARKNSILNSAKIICRITILFAYVILCLIFATGQLTPWNHPLLIAVKKIAPALACGNSIVLKPSELAPVTVLEFAAMCSEAGLPDGVLNVLPGLGPEAGKALCVHPHIRKVDLTGGTATGRAVGEGTVLYPGL